MSADFDTLHRDIVDLRGHIDEKLKEETDKLHTRISDLRKEVKADREADTEAFRAHEKECTEAKATMQTQLSIIRWCGGAFISALILVELQRIFGTA